MIGPPNEGKIEINGLEALGLIDTGSQVTCVSETFYKSMVPCPKLLDVADFGLKVQGANGNELRYTGYIVADVQVPFLSKSVVLPSYILVIADTEYNLKVPVIIGTNVINRLKAKATSEAPKAWANSF